MSAGEPPQLQLERLRFERLDSTRHDRTGFHCGVATLDRYLWEHATQDMRRGANTVYVLVDDREPSRVLGYFTLCSLGLEPAKVPDDLRRLLPKYPQVSCTLVGRLAVTENQHRRGLGALLLVVAAIYLFVKLMSPE